MTGVVIVGIQALIDKLDGLENALASGEIVEAAGQRWIDNMFVPQAKAAAPVDTGEYRDGIGGEVDASGIHLWASAPHSLEVEYGTSKMHAFGTMHNTLENTADDLIREIDAEIEKRLR